MPVKILVLNATESKVCVIQIPSFVCVFVQVRAGKAVSQVGETVSTGSCPTPVFPARLPSHFEPVQTTSRMSQWSTGVLAYRKALAVTKTGFSVTSWAGVTL